MPGMCLCWVKGVSSRPAGGHHPAVCVLGEGKGVYVYVCWVKGVSSRPAGGHHPATLTSTARCHNV